MENNALMTLKDDEYLNSFPAGYRFRPTDEELITHYLSNKVVQNPLPPNKIRDIYLYDYSPEQLSAMYKEPGEDTMYFFTTRERKYPRGKRPNRVAVNGFWKASGTDKPVGQKRNPIGFNKSLVFFEGNHKEAIKSDWLMREFRLNEEHNFSSGTSHDTKLDGLVLCKVYKKEKKSQKGQEEDRDEDPYITSTDMGDEMSEPEPEHERPSQMVPELPTISPPDAIFHTSTQSMLGCSTEENSFPMPNMPHPDATCRSFQQMPGYGGQNSFSLPIMAHPAASYDGRSSQMLGYNGENAVSMPGSNSDLLLSNEGHYSCASISNEIRPYHYYNHHPQSNQVSVDPFSPSKGNMTRGATSCISAHSTPGNCGQNSFPMPPLHPHPYAMSFTSFQSMPGYSGQTSVPMPQSDQALMLPNTVQSDIGNHISDQVFPCQY